MPLTHRCTSELRSISTPNFSIKRNSSTIQINREDIPVSSSERKQVEDKRQPSHPELKLSELPPAGAHYVVRSESSVCVTHSPHTTLILIFLSSDSVAARALQEWWELKLTALHACHSHMDVGVTATAKVFRWVFDSWKSESHIFFSKPQSCNKLMPSL